MNQSHASPPQTDQAATSRWSRFGHKQEVLGYLLAEQYQLCCYSELRADQQGLGYHIEHVENKSQHPQRTFDYINLAASALRSDDLSPFIAAQPVVQQPQTVFGGHAPGKQQAVDMQRFVSPHQADCTRFFAYLSDGRIVPADGLDNTDADRAQYTIDLLNLNSPFLVTQRRNWWDELDRLFAEHLTDDTDLHCLAGIDLLPRNQSLSPFFTLTRQFFGSIAEEVLHQDAPELL
ncbi:retron system putative HNH endonuclease [Azotobacter chroococcum]|uniref:retron system putative HNH endonuclease n=1 Tax=Azotobacter chroococcum TaxID=353 RepID=UPI001F0DEB28|nr:retron system putative HNH endonuclease [Azotobacter chroococcum]